MDQSTDPLFGVPVERLVAITGAHLTTARRWKRFRRPPQWLAALIELCVGGELDRISRTWRGWKIRGEHLVSPEGWEFTPGAIRAIPFMKAQIKTYQEKQRCIQQADWVDQRWVDPKDVSAAAAGAARGYRPPGARPATRPLARRHGG